MIIRVLIWLSRGSLAKKNNSTTLERLYREHDSKRDFANTKVGSPTLVRLACRVSAAIP